MKETKEQCPTPRLSDFLKAVGENRLLQFCIHNRPHCRRSSDKRTYIFTDRGTRRVDRLILEEQKRLEEKKVAA